MSKILFTYKSFLIIYIGLYSLRIICCIKNSHAIEVGWTRSDWKMTEDLFGQSVDFDRTKPTNSEFLVTIADKLRLDNKVCSK